ncbi:tripartite tricarboxylate transporter substrate binding protein [Ramlibacter sp. AW1]|uniref:Tripartite tricarboxylate transporter substrate binding protein n=1 Tax=Ramlibacter aurantiacus TaxID=2801330 RepID=A0A937D2D2_9BURK|nr:tripartite tricarboxylate transporter substrate binding protein [Ramlibacter aurantiacus]
MALLPLLLSLSAFASGSAGASNFPVPDKPVRILVGLAPGGPTDLQARVVAEHLRRELNTHVVVENRPGASMTIATAEVARAPADGHTLLYSPSTPFAQNPHTFAKLPYDPLKGFTPISVGSVGPLVLVAHQSVPGDNLQQLVAYAKANPGKLNYGSFGQGSSSHLFGQLMAKQYGIDMVHVPYKGAGDVQKDLIAGRVQLMFAAAGGAVQFVRSGNVRMIGVVAPQRSPLLPGVPTLAEQGAKGLDIEGWVGFFGPAHMPPATVARLNAALVKVLAEPQVKSEFAKGAYEAVSSTPQAFATTVRESYEQWGRIAADLGIQKD